jgi:putative transport protein
MNGIAELLRNYPEVALFATLSLGYFFGQFRYGRIGLGTVASTLLVGVVIGLAEVKISAFTKSVFFYLFIFAIGYKVGPQFFRGLRGEGMHQAILSVIFCLTALVTVWAISRVMGYDKGLAAGLAAGAIRGPSAAPATPSTSSTSRPRSRQGRSPTSPSPIP